MSYSYSLSPFDSKKFQDLQDKGVSLKNSLMECVDSGYEVENEMDYSSRVSTPNNPEFVNFATLISNALNDDLNEGEAKNSSDLEKTIEILDKIGSDGGNVTWGVAEPFIGYITYEEASFLVKFLDSYDFQDKITSNYRNFLINTLKDFTKKGKGAAVSIF